MGSAVVVDTHIQGTKRQVETLLVSPVTMRLLVTRADGFVQPKFLAVSVDMRKSWKRKNHELKPGKNGSVHDTSQTHLLWFGVRITFEF
jgi:hypothetical protein